MYVFTSVEWCARKPFVEWFPGHNHQLACCPPLTPGPVCTAKTGSRPPLPVSPWGHGQPASQLGRCLATLHYAAPTNHAATAEHHQPRCHTTGVADGWWHSNAAPHGSTATLGLMTAQLCSTMWQHSNTDDSTAMQHHVAAQQHCDWRQHSNAAHGSTSTLWLMTAQLCSTMWQHSNTDTWQHSYTAPCGSTATLWLMTAQLCSTTWQHSNTVTAQQCSSTATLWLMTAQLCSTMWQQHCDSTAIQHHVAAQQHWLMTAQLYSTMWQHSNTDWWQHSYAAPCGSTATLWQHSYAAQQPWYHWDCWWQHSNTAPHKHWNLQHSNTLLQ